MANPDFISDEEMKKLETNGVAKDFISDEEMESMSEDSLFTSKGLIKGAAEALPVAGALAGTIGGIPGVVAGAAAGKALENIAEKYLLDEEKTRPEIYLEPAGEGVAAATGEFAAPVISKGISKAISGIGTGLKKTVSSMSSIPEKAIETYIDRPQAVKAVGRLAEDTAIQDAADRLRSEAVASIYDTTKEATEEISYILMQKGDRLLNVAPIKDVGKSIISKLNPKIESHAKQIAEIQKKIDEITNLQINKKLPFVKASDVQSVKLDLQDASDYTADGMIKSKKNIADTTMKQMARQARILLEDFAPEIKKQNQTLSNLHNIRKNINKNLITPEKTAASVMGVGSGQNQQSIKQMRKLEKVTGFPYVKGAEEISSAVHFSDPALIPTVNTGRAAIPAMGMLGAGQQFMSGNVAPAIASLGFGALGSPMAIKAGMDIGLGSSMFAKKVSPLGSTEMAEQLMVRALQMGIAPFAIDGMIKNAEQLTPTEKAKLRNKNAKAVK